MSRHEYFAACTLGIEAALAMELQQLGAHDLATRPGGVSFTGDRRLGYAANLWLRSAIRVQQVLARFPAKGPAELHARATELEWERYMTLDQTLSVDASVKSSAITHSQFAALRIKDAIVDRFRRQTGRRPNVDPRDADLPLKLLLDRDHATLYRNMSGVSLHKRGWRPVQVKSPLNEATAAGLLLLSGWDRSSTLVDPMCGSGTFVIEAALLAAERAPGLQRLFPFELWPDFDKAAWQELRAEAEQRQKPRLPFVIEGADHHAGALEIARQSAAAAGVAELVTFTSSEVRDLRPRERAATVVVNPPWGERLGEGAELEAAWRDLGGFLHRCKGATAYVLSGNPELTRHLGLRAASKHPVMNGPIECRWLRYDIADSA